MARAFLAFVSITLCLLLPLPANAVVSTLTQQPSWVDLTPQQKQILAPLAGEWDKLEAWRRKKWVGIAQRYPAMKPEEQARIQRRMKDWIKLTPDERKIVREQYKDVRKATPDQKEVLKQKWQEYKELPEDEKTRLKAQAAAKPVPKSATGKPLTPALVPRTPPRQPLAPGPQAATLAPTSAPPSVPPAR